MKNPTKEQILEASKSCPEAKTVLKKLYPDVFSTPDSDKDVTKDIEFELESTGSAYWINLRYEGKIVAFLGYAQLCDRFDAREKVTIRKYTDAFKIVLK